MRPAPRLLRFWPRWSFFDALATTLHGTEEVRRQRLSLDTGWKFHRSDEWPDAVRLDKAVTSSGPVATAFEDAGWREVRVPHDWAGELPFDPASDRNHGDKPLGPRYPGNSATWYRRTFDLSAADANERIRLTFDGVLRDATVVSVSLSSSSP